MVCICEIKPIIKSIVNQRKTYMQYNTIEKKCHDYHYAKEQRKEAEKLEKQYWGEFVDKANEYMDYPVKKRIGFNRTQKVEVKYDDEIVGETYIMIPFIEKQQYYCLMHLLNKLECFYRFGDKYVFQIGDEEDGI